LKVGLTGGSGSDTLDPHKGLTYLDTARAQSLYQPLLQLNTAAPTENLRGPFMLCRAAIQHMLTQPLRGRA
jgi:hypothetical protein